MENPTPIEAIKKVQNYIESNLHKRMSLHELANVAGYSPWYLSKLFKKYCGKTIFDYIRALRLSQAALYLRDNDTTIIEVAFDFIFDSHEGFTRAFSKEFGITPKKYAQTTPPIKLFIPTPANDWENKPKGQIMSDKTSVIFTQVIERSKRKAIIKRGVDATHYFEYCDEVSCDVWGELCSIKGALYEPMGMWLPPKLIKPGTSLYVQGVEMPDDYDGPVPDGYDLITLAPCKMMIFQGEKYDDDNFQVEVSKVMEAIDDYDPEPFGFVWAPDDAPRFQYAPLGSRGYIEGRPVRQIAK